MIYELWRPWRLAPWHVQVVGCANMRVWFEYMPQLAGEVSDTKLYFGLLPKSLTALSIRVKSQKGEPRCNLLRPGMLVHGGHCQTSARDVSYEKVCRNPGTSPPSLVDVTAHDSHNRVWSCDHFLVPSSLKLYLGKLVLVHERRKFNTIQ